MAAHLHPRLHVGARRRPRGAVDAEVGLEVGDVGARALEELLQLGSKGIQPEDINHTSVRMESG